MGLFTLEDARARGISRQTLHSMVTAHRLVRLYDGVFGLVGTPDSWERRAQAALLAGGPHAVLRGEAAGFLHGLRDVGRGQIRLVFPRAKRRDVRGVDCVETRRLGPGDVVRIGGLRATSLLWTLDDLAAERGARWAERAFYGAWRRGQTCAEDLRTFLRRPTQLAARPVLEAILDRAEPSFARSLSPKEVDGLLELRDRGLPLPEVNYPVRIGGRTRYIDFAWPLVKLAVEIDGRETHSIPADVAADRARQAELEAAGWTVLRIPASWLDRHPERVAARVATALAELGHPAVA
jgi:very-short-patch-repair endonuclease